MVFIHRVPVWVFCQKQTHKNTTNKPQNSEFLIKQKTKENSNLMENTCGKTHMNNLWSGYQEQASFGARACPPFPICECECIIRTEPEATMRRTFPQRITWKISIRGRN